ncbi:MAG: hypothetical protein IK001_04290 [Lachnospiraceae bacterium]|nr:hypothetical protein [Lachnospiraceae bacterium]
MPDRIEEILKEIHVMFAKCEAYGNSPDLVIISKSELFELLEKLNEGIDDVLDQYEATTRSRERARIEQDKQAAETVARAKLEADDVHAAASLYTDTMLEDLKQILEATKSRVKDDMLDLLANIELQEEVLDRNKESVKEGLAELHDSEMYLNALTQLRKKAEEKRKFGDQAELLAHQEENIFEEQDKEKQAQKLEIRIDKPGENTGVTYSTRFNRNKKKKKKTGKGSSDAVHDGTDGEPEGLKADSDHIPGTEYSADDFDLDREYEEWKAAEEGEDLDRESEKKGFGSMLKSLFGKSDE